MSFLLREHYQIKPGQETLTEMKKTVAEGGPLIIKAVIQRADAKNQNGRIYPYKILKEKCDEYKEKIISVGNALGELDHEDSPVINVKNASHVIDDIWWDGPEGKDVYGSIRILPTPMGDIAKNIILAGVPLGISSRAVGSVSKNEAQGYDVVQEDLQIICWDLVGTPSTHNAFLKLHEAIDLGNYDASKAFPKEVRIREALNELLRKTN